MFFCKFFPQVQLLVSTSDVENYKQIKTDLDELRLMVEKSELWVYKRKHSDSGGGKKKKKDKEKDKEKGEGGDKVRTRGKRG